MSNLPEAVTLATSATETAADVASALAPVLDGFSWWSAVAAVLTWLIIAAPIIDRVVDWTDTRIDNTIWRWFKALAGGLTRRKR